MSKKLGTVKEINLGGCSVAGKGELAPQAAVQVVVQKEIDHEALDAISLRVAELTTAHGKFQARLVDMFTEALNVIENEKPVIVKQIDHLALLEVEHKLESLELAIARIPAPLAAVAPATDTKTSAMVEALSHKIDRVNLADHTRAEKRHSESVIYERAIVLIGLIDLVLNLLPYFK